MPDRERLRWEEEGSRLSAGSAALLEKELATNPGDMRMRAMLLSFYYTRKLGVVELGLIALSRGNWVPKSRVRHQEHVFWLIANQPQSAVAGSHYLRINPVFNPNGYRQARDLWLSTIDSNSADVASLCNAAKFLALHDKEVALKLAGRAYDLDPNNQLCSDTLDSVRRIKDA